MEIPGYIDQEVWEGFLEMRISIKKKMTPYAQKLMFKRIEKLMLEGQDPNKMIEQSIMFNWQGIFKVKQGEAKEDFVERVTDRSWAGDIPDNIRLINNQR